MALSNSSVTRVYLYFLYQISSNKVLLIFQFKCSVSHLTIKNLPRPLNKTYVLSQISISSSVELNNILETTVVGESISSRL